MRYRIPILLGFPVLFCCILSNISAQEKKSQYTTVNKCKSCHSYSTIGGLQYLKWAESSHSRAYKDLLGAKANEIAAQAGIADPSQSERCLKCHVTTLDFKTDELRAEGVGCERCHGAGALFAVIDVMRNREQALTLGLAPLKGDTPQATLQNTEKLCRQCHGLEHKDENPAAKDFNFEQAWSKIKHDKESLKQEFPGK